MKQYIIKNTDIMHNGIIIPEGDKIDLDDKDAQSLSAYLEDIKDNVTLIVSSRAESRDEGSTKNTDQNTKIKRSK